MILSGLYFLLIFVLAVYSFALLDPNLTLLNHPLWTDFRNVMVNFGYNQRFNSWLVYLAIVFLLFLFHYLFIFFYKKNKIDPIKISLVIGGLLLFSYPFLSADFFSYIFYGRIFTYYNKNPYTMIPGDFYLDPWLRFTQWTGHNLLYGPIFFLVSVIPSFLGLAKFLPTFILFKGVNIVFYLLAVWLLKKLNEKWAIIFATSPLVIIEGLINSHNDLIAVSLVIIGIYFLNKKKNYMSFLFILMSVGIKYLTLPFLILFTKFKINKQLTFFGVVGILVFWIVRSEIQPWYFIMIFGLLPFYESIINRLNIFYFGLLLSYYPFVRFGGWGRVLYWTTEDKVILKHKIIIIFFIINLFYLAYLFFNNKKYIYKAEK